MAPIKGRLRTVKSLRESRQSHQRSSRPTRASRNPAPSYVFSSDSEESVEEEPQEQLQVQEETDLEVTPAQKQIIRQFFLESRLDFGKHEFAGSSMWTRKLVNRLRANGSDGENITEEQLKTWLGNPPFAQMVTDLKKWAEQEVIRVPLAPISSRKPPSPAVLSLEPMPTQHLLFRSIKETLARRRGGSDIIYESSAIPPTQQDDDAEFFFLDGRVNWIPAILTSNPPYSPGSPSSISSSASIAEIVEPQVDTNRQNAMEEFTTPTLRESQLSPTVSEHEEPSSPSPSNSMLEPENDAGNPILFEVTSRHRQIQVVKPLSQNRAVLLREKIMLLRGQTDAIFKTFKHLQEMGLEGVEINALGERVSELVRFVHHLANQQFE